MTERSIPANIDAERATLGSLLLNREAIAAVAPWLRADAFYLEKHAWIYDAIVTLFDRGTPPDLRLVAAELTRHDRLDAIGGIASLMELTDGVPTSYHVEYYARLVTRAATLRGLILAGGRIAAIGYDDQDEAAALAAAQTELDSLNDRPTADDGLVPIAAIVDARYADLARAVEEGTPKARGLMTGFRDLDQLTGGLHKGDFVIIAARASVGKTALSNSIAYQVASVGKRVGIFSLEMSREQVIDRLLAIDSGVNAHAIRNFALRDTEHAAVMQSFGRLHELPIAVNDQPGISVAGVRSHLLRSASRDGAWDLVVVDYLQLLAPEGRRGGNREQDVAGISRALKNLARELNVPVIALSQFSRAIEGRADHRPLLSDLRESGGIENDADIVIGIYRDELYDQETEKRGIAELFILKARNGPTGVIPLRFDPHTTRFMDLTWRSPEGY